MESCPKRRSYHPRPDFNCAAEIDVLKLFQPLGFLAGEVIRKAFKLTGIFQFCPPLEHPIEEDVRGNTISPAERQETFEAGALITQLITLDRIGNNAARRREGLPALFPRFPEPLEVLSKYFLSWTLSIPSPPRNRYVHGICF